MKWAALFPGQGSQHVGMGQFLYDNFNSVKELFELASDTLSLDFKQLLFTDPKDQLNLTEFTQPALLLNSTAAAQVLIEEVEFSAVASAGHSVGEYAALVHAGALPFTEGLKAVKIRGQAMQEAVPAGAGGMVAALGLPHDWLPDLCAWVQDQTPGKWVLESANFNSPAQVVLSGSLPAVEWVTKNFEDFEKQLTDTQREALSPAPSRMMWIPLKVSAPFHCSLMASATETMRDYLDQLDFLPATHPVVQNVNAQACVDAKKLRNHLIDQISSPVKWVDCVQTLISQEAITHGVELGPGKTLCGLHKKIDTERQMKMWPFQSLEDLKKIEVTLKA